MLNREEVRHALTGPVMSLGTPFHENGDIDYEGVRRIIDYTVDEGGSKTVIITAGDSLFTVLSDDEIAELTKVVVDHTAGRAMVIAAADFWSTRQTVEFAHYARDTGADMLMVAPPDWALSCTDDSVVEHYSRVAACGIPIMVVTNFLIPRPDSFRLHIIERLRDEVDGIYAVKDDVNSGEFGRRLSLLAYDRWALFVTGTKRQVLNAMPYGCDGYMSNFISFKPELAHAFWKAAQAGDQSGIRTFIAENDIPFFELHSGFEVCLDAILHGILELKGLAKRWRRAPYHSLNDEEMAKLADLLKGKGWL